MGLILLIVILCGSGTVKTVDSKCATANTTILSNEVRKFHKRLDKMPRRMFDFELKLKDVTGHHQAEVNEASRSATGIREKLVEVSNEVYNLELLVDRISKNRGEEEGEEEEEEKGKCSNWTLAMNLNPSDGHIMGYSTGWSDGSWIGNLETALTNDYLNQTVWTLPADYIAIVRHHQGAVDAVKVFVFKDRGLSLSNRFKLTDNNYRSIVTEGGPKQTYTAPGANNLADDPVFSVGGDLAFNWGYGRSGTRIALTGGHLSDAESKDYNTHGLGNHFDIDPKTEPTYIDDLKYAHEISNIQDCSGTSCDNVGDVQVQGTDHGAAYHYVSGPVYGNYALYVSSDQTSFPTDGARIGVDVVLC